MDISKHQHKPAACDECGMRLVSIISTDSTKFLLQGAKKTKCTGETPSCSRCMHKGVTCVYSLQQPMGRPKKRRRTSDVEALSPIPSMNDPMYASSLEISSLTNDPISVPFDLDTWNTNDFGHGHSMRIPSLMSTTHA